MIIVSGTCTYRHDVMRILRTLPLLKTLLWYVNGHLNTNHSHDAEIGIYCSYIVQWDTSDVGSIYIPLYTILFQHSVKFSRSSVFVFEFFAQ